jgi:SET family sugar efflux transporter-like MFS transporter
VWPAAAALALFHTAMFMGSNALSIVTVTTLNGSETDVGLLFSLCAAIEVVVMGAFVVVPARRASRTVLVVGFLLFAAYFLSAVLLPSLATLYWAQLLRAAAIGIVSVIGMLHIQALMPRQAGSAAAVFGNTVNAGWLLSGLATGFWAEAFGYWSIFGLCAVLSFTGAALYMLPLSRSLPPSATGPEAR